MLCPHSSLQATQEKLIPRVRLLALREGGKVMVAYISLNLSCIRTDLPHRSNLMGPHQDWLPRPLQS